jgi:DNA replication protein DnaC
MSDTNPHGFPALWEAASKTYRERRAEAIQRWRGAHQSPAQADAVLADWSEAIATDAAMEAIAEDAERAREQQARLERRRDDVSRTFLAAGAAPRDVRLWQEGGYKETDSLREARALLVSPRERPFLVLSGKVGSGKTCGVTLALLERAAVTEQWTGRDTPCFWIAAEVALGALLGKAGEERLEQAKTAPVLVIEDLGSESMLNADVWLSMLGVVVDERYRREAITIITTNLDMEALRKRYGERVADRLRQCARLKGTEARSLRVAP